MPDKISYGPFSLYESDAYKQAKQLKAEEEALKMEKLRLDLSQARNQQEMESPSGRATRAGELSTFLEQEKQKQFGIPIGEEISAKMIARGGPSILEATKMQGELDVSERARQARIDAVRNYLAGEKSILPTSKVDLGGVSTTVPSGMAGQASADIYGDLYKNQVPRVASTYQAEGYTRDEAIRMASADVRASLFKANEKGRVIIQGEDPGTTMSFSNSEAMKMWRDPSTPPHVKAQLKPFFGQTEQPKAANWINSRLGR